MSQKAMRGGLSGCLLLSTQIKSLDGFPVNLQFLDLRLYL